MLRSATQVQFRYAPRLGHKQRLCQRLRLRRLQPPYAGGLHQSIGGRSCSGGQPASARLASSRRHTVQATAVPAGLPARRLALRVIWGVAQTAAAATLPAAAVRKAAAAAAGSQAEPRSQSRAAVPEQSRGAKAQPRRQSRAAAPPGGCSRSPRPPQRVVQRAALPRLVNDSQQDQRLRP